MEYGLYIHLPFCNKRCPYCAFFSSVSEHHLIESYIKAAILEYGKKKELFTGCPVTVYLGGGTPSIIPAEMLETIASAISLENVTEFTVEANPESMSEQWMEALLDFGVNRLSIGIQSFSDKLLARLGRLHDSGKAVEAVEKARKTGFTNISIDLMFGIPGQTMEDWIETIDKTVSLRPQHISSYSLTIEEDTEFMNIALKKGLRVPGNSEIADMYFIMDDEFAREGYSRYEISNFALAGFECAHNKMYWDHSPYLGIGASAHSFCEDKRMWNIKDIPIYIKKCENNIDPAEESEIIDFSKKILETIMLSLRTSAGLDTYKVGNMITRQGNRETSKKPDAIRDKCRLMTEKGFLCERDSGVFVLTSKGAMVSDEIMSELVSILD